MTGHDSSGIPYRRQTCAEMPRLVLLLVGLGRFTGLLLPLPEASPPLGPRMPNSRL